ncbi:3-isopropylmalate dehydratase small subunit [Pectobacterium parmentieri]|uniref:3-isopropylmalate dehydratase small subunit n=1 Tax=Pectobacterium parmentieri TaxID=1905730 RepID=UPI000CDD6FC8|nr:3-isopropylmalate dehydratase small subunit [Pectobacterium parmentieri]AYH05027.1 3-isopropylmalate dehydratase small subunit [Pectobacterium parmentieri]AYH13848.1 3-isopropylmalate dehydratase small subunit [Pectobacterium parmentieri]AYH22551.1 3-isopropylmalate dehydratase small subunit [Pectobacterium parmentieri]MBI0519392.1 3-isopropylmalate dehydratase small subunit [Pectobacterium parmentieri]MBI0550624.1 3-isopropylmalate dehydratase small subunit [Pectobacterium parmentieri]
MDTFKKISGLAAPMLAANIDTDVIMPKQFLKGIDRQGLDKGLFYDLRFNADGTENSDFILNTPQWKGAKFLVTGPNFGCGSSREHAVWGMKQLGIRALIGTSFAGIFNDNCLRNGVLTITLAEDKMSELARIISHIETNEILIDLENQIISTEKEDFTFNVDELKKEMLVQGLDAIGLTLSFKDEIIQFENEYYSENPWHKVS